MVKQRIGAINSKLIEKSKRYKELTGISTVELVEKLLTDFFKDIKLTNEYIDINEIYYFNFKELLNNKEVKASKNKPSQDLKETFIVKKIPNNLDEFDQTKNTFCYNGKSEKHLGIYSYNLFISKLKFKDTELVQYYILFEYNEKTEELDLKIIDLEDITLLIDLNKISKVLSDLNEFNNIFIKELERIKKMPEEKKLYLKYGKPLFEYDNPLVYLGSSNVIESYRNAKKMAKEINRVDSEMYDELKGRYNSRDLVIFRDGKLVKHEEVNDIKQLEKKESDET
ncbi:hypothetical protein [Methanobrevibacter sp.]|uniref:hypothetical protein n=1 Tax=Methanobrevibacter sp. TaxID=66852 RepID=UPI0025FF41E2|nr:hypothetical protein [Methanobrevibacter sp.]MBQ2831382.1 hypothetical protein [Methanobrevibacter sp.]